MSPLNCQMIFDPPNVLKEKVLNCTHFFIIPTPQVTQFTTPLLSCVFQ